MAVIAAPFAEDQAVRSSQAAGSPIGRNRFVQHEIRTNGKSVFYRRHAVGDGEDDRLGVGFSLAQLANQVAAALDVVAVDEDRVELAAVDGLPGGIGGGDRLHLNAHRFQHTSYNAQDFLIACEEERFQHHIQNLTLFTTGEQLTNVTAPSIK